jgi:hypothetical protein
VAHAKILTAEEIEAPSSLDACITAVTTLTNVRNKIKYCAGGPNYTIGYLVGLWGSYIHRIAGIRALSDLDCT